MMFGSSASISSWSSVSSFDHASGFLDSTKSSLLTNQNNKSQRHASSGISCTSSDLGHLSRVLRHRKSPKNYSYDKLQEGRENDMGNHIPLVPSEKNNIYRSCEKNLEGSIASISKSSKASISAKRKGSIRASSGPKTQPKKGEATNITYPLSSSRKNKSTKKNVQKDDSGDSVTSNPQRSIKELFIVQKDNKRQKGNVGKCAVCSAFYSIPYIERHIINKHPTFVLNPSSANKMPQNDKNMLARSTHLRPRVVITKLNFPKESTETCLSKPSTIDSKRTGSKTTKNDRKNKVKDTTNELYDSDRVINKTFGSKKSIIKSKKSREKSQSEHVTKTKDYNAKKLTNSKYSSGTNKGTNKIISTKDTKNSNKKTPNEATRKRESQASDMDKMNNKVAATESTGK